MLRFLVPLALTAGSVLCLAGPCENLSSLVLPRGSITISRSIGAGEFTPPPEDSTPAATTFKDLPAFCRVTATLRPSSDSVINIEVWLPASGWNGKLEGVGNGGYAGSISHAALAVALRRGYAAAETDGGHQGNNRDASFMLGHPEKMIDFGYRAVHEMTLAAKSLITSYYKRGPQLAYWVGCSTGGRQALAEAQMYADDYDAIVAGAPGNNTELLALPALAIAQAVHKNDASYIPPELYPVIHKAVLTACDANDGVKDGLLEDPTLCNFDPKVLECKTGADASTCLTAARVETVKAVYNPMRNQHAPMLPLGLQPGSELGWGNMAGPEPFFYADEFWRNTVANDARWSYKTLNLEAGLAQAEKQERQRGDAGDANLKPFFARGGKLIQYHGWSDQNIPPQNSIRYHQRVADTLAGGPALSGSYRLFMVPGMAHCGGGEGPNNFDMLGALEKWREEGQAPERIIASRVSNGVVGRTRPLCPYPQVAAYKGAGSADDAGNFSCKAP